MVRTFTAEQAQTTLFAGFMQAARRYGPGKIILEDADGAKLSYAKLALASLVLGGKLASRTAPGETVGVMLPNSAGLTITLLGLNAFGRTAAILNFTTGKKQLVSALQTGRISTVLTSRRFIDAANLSDVAEALSQTDAPDGAKVRVVALEDVRANIGTLDKLTGPLKGGFAGLTARRARTNAPAVVLFTSGTEGTPKGVVLTNANLMANVFQSLTHLGDVLVPGEVLFNPLPIFHSFGLTAGTLVPLMGGVKCVLYPSPLHYRQIPKSISQAKATFMVATDTFVGGYARAAEPGQLDSLKYVVCGAERVKEQTRKLVEAANTVLLEGYGVTETAPVLAVNQPAANRSGTVGRLVPGIEMRLEPVPGLSEGQRLFVRGPNVMAGYLLADRPGELVPPEGGWHDTGDIVTVEDGYISIRGRAKRFAKLGGEMVSLAAVESLAGGLWRDAQHVVLSFPDPKKGEQLVLVTETPGATKEALLAHARKEGFPELWVPKAVLVVPSIPVLASGKIDLQATQDMAANARPLL
jgi:acyl-[acyl-carrier-protein]-phospholipid O-acyltransferase / long-chain-fatty-acid--[acyl-carrier-protein] ligase